MKVIIDKKEYDQLISENKKLRETLEENGKIAILHGQPWVQSCHVLTESAAIKMIFRKSSVKDFKRMKKQFAKEEK